jgi:hypothetical protein
MDPFDEWETKQEWITQVRDARDRGRHETDIENDLIREGKFSNSFEAHRFVEFVRFGAPKPTSGSTSGTLLSDLIPTIEILGGAALVGLGLVGGFLFLNYPGELGRDFDEYNGDGVIGIAFAFVLGVSLLRAGIRNLFSK